MRVLIAHNFYSSAQPSGENQTVEEIVQAARELGIDVSLFGPSSDHLNALSAAGRLGVARRAVWAPSSSAFMEAVREARPDIVQVHNVYPNIAPMDLKRLTDAGIPVVHVIHNYRHTCIAGNHFRDGASCFDCTSGRFGNLPGLVHGCYRGSRPQSAIMTLSNSLFHGTWRNLYYTCISEHMRHYIEAAGFPRGRVRVIPNPVGSLAGSVDLSSGSDVLFAGRLEPEKGLTLLLEAWRGLDSAVKRGAFLHIAGSGSQADIAQAVAREQGDVSYHGRLSPEALEDLGRRCKISAIPSLWDEPFGRIVVEAYRAGRGVVVTNRGALPELVQEGRTGWVGATGVTGLRSALATAMLADSKSLRSASHGYWRSAFTREAVAAQYRDWWQDIVECQKTRLS